jgi:pimeloyl-ACP methyl ester carboxylesterase
MAMPADDVVGPLVLVHGAWHGAWCWSEVIGRIDSDCPQVVAVDLPFESLESDATYLRRIVTDLGPRTVICGHSYGGRLTSIVADDVEVGHLIYLAAPTPNELQFRAYANAERLRTGEIPSFQTAWSTFFSGCSREQAYAAWQRLRPMRTPPGSTDGLEHRPWERLPSTYLICLRDHALLPEVQREMASNMTFSASIDADHSPFLTAPAALADLLNNVLRHGAPQPQPEP